MNLRKQTQLQVISLCSRRVAPAGSGRASREGQVGADTIDTRPEAPPF